jgi:hypothetical protein
MIPIKSNMVSQQHTSTMGSPLHRGSLDSILPGHVYFSVSAATQEKENDAMALIPCTECKQSISEEATVCPHCGKPQPADSSFKCLECFVTNYETTRLCRGCGKSLEPSLKSLEASRAENRAGTWGFMGFWCGFWRGWHNNDGASCSCRGSHLGCVLVLIGLVVGGYFGAKLGYALAAPPKEDEPKILP